MKFVIEHLEPELYEWCLIEYEHISKIVGKANLIFTNIKGKKDTKKLEKLGEAYGKSISELKFRDVCILSQYSRATLKASDKNKFKYIVLGGILGDNPAGKRTISLIQKSKSKKMKFQTRNLGNKQMPTDTAAYVAKKILGGKQLRDFKFADSLEIEINGNESISMNFRYVVDKNKAVISEKLIDYLRKRKEF